MPIVASVFPGFGRNDQGEHQGDEADLPGSTPTLKVTNAVYLMPRKSGAGQCAGETKPVQQAEDATAGGAGGQHWFRCTATSERSGPRNGYNAIAAFGSTGTSAYPVSQPRACSVRHGECGHSLQQHPAISHDRQTQNEEHMIGAE